jgi:hypothetical protein
MRSEIVNIIDTIAKLDGRISIEPFGLAKCEKLGSSVVWAYHDRRGPQTVIRFGDSTFRPKDGRKSVIIDTGGAEFDYEIKAIMLLLYHIGRGEGGKPFKWSTVLHRSRLLVRFARFSYARGLRSFRDITRASEIAVRSLLLQFVNGEEASGGLNCKIFTSSVKSCRDALKHLADYGLVSPREFMLVLDDLTLGSIRHHEENLHLRHSIIPTSVMKRLIAEATAYIARAEQQYGELESLMLEAETASAKTQCRDAHSVFFSTNGRVHRRLWAVLKEYFIELHRHVYVLTLAFTGMRDEEAYHLKSGSAGVRDENGEQVYFIKTLLSKTDDEVIELDWVANSLAYDAVSLLSRVNLLFYRRAKFILLRHRSKLTKKRVHNLELGLEERNIFGVQLTAGGTSIFIWNYRPSDNPGNRLSLTRYAIPVTTQDIAQLEKLDSITARSCPPVGYAASHTRSEIFSTSQRISFVIHSPGS